MPNTRYSSPLFTAVTIANTVPAALAERPDDTPEFRDAECASERLKAFAATIALAGEVHHAAAVTVTPLGERFYGVPADVAGNGNGSLSVYDFGLFPGNSPELGLMLITNGDRGTGNRGGATKDTEALLFKTP